MHKVLISDFDGTMTQFDFYKLVVERFIPRQCPDYWASYRSGTMTHFEALNAYFMQIRADERQVLAILDDMRLDPELSKSVDLLALRGWQVIVTSAGCEWYIRKLLSQAGVDIKVHANPGTFHVDKGLEMRLPVESQFYSLELGIDKAAVVRHFLNRGFLVAFAGDGYPDAEPAKLVPDDLRFARGELAEQLTAESFGFRSFNRWSEVADALIKQDPNNATYQ